MCSHEFNHRNAQWSTSLAATIQVKLMKPHMRHDGMTKEVRERLDGLLDEYSKAGADCAQHIGKAMIGPLIDWANGTKESTKERVEELRRLLEQAEEQHERHTSMGGRRAIERRELEAAAEVADAKAKSSANEETAGAYQIATDKDVAAKAQHQQAAAADTSAREDVDAETVKRAQGREQPASQSTQFSKLYRRAQTHAGHQRATESHRRVP